MHPIFPPPCRLFVSCLLSSFNESRPMQCTSDVCLAPGIAMFQPQSWVVGAGGDRHTQAAAAAAAAHNFRLGQPAAVCHQARRRTPATRCGSTGSSSALLHAGPLPPYRPPPPPAHPPPTCERRKAGLLPVGRDGAAGVGEVARVDGGAAERGVEGKRRRQPRWRTPPGTPQRSQRSRGSACPPPWCRTRWSGRAAAGGQAARGAGVAWGGWAWGGG